MIKLQRVDGKGYSSIHTIRGVLRPAFQMAEEDDLIRKNPFGFELVNVIVNDSVRREAVTRKQEREFLRFIKEDAHFASTMMQYLSSLTQDFVYQSSVDLQNQIWILKTKEYG